MALTPILGVYIAKVMQGERTYLSPMLRPVERAIYRLSGIDETAEQDWKSYAISVLAMALVAVVIGYLMLRLQDVLPLNPGAAAAQAPPISVPSRRPTTSRALFLRSTRNGSSASPILADRRRHSSSTNACGCRV